jgi:hypothetical protein
MMHALSKSFSVTLSAVVLLAGCESGPDVAPLNDWITADMLRANLSHLAGDDFLGRLAGSPEIEKAADWIRDHFRSLNLTPAGQGDTYEQRFDLMRFSLGEENQLRVEGAGDPRAPGEEWYPLSFGGSASAEGEVAFVGFGIVEPRLSYDDYRGADVTGKIVLVLEREPGVADTASAFDGLVSSEASAGWRKALWAQERGAVGILFVRDVHNRGPVEDWGEAAQSYWPDEPRRIERLTLGRWMQQITIPAAAISARLAETLVAGAGSTLEQLAAASETATGLGVTDLDGSRVSLTTSVVRHALPGRNILGMIEGSDSTLWHEVVVIGAHHDHNGADSAGVYNGADDDGSGTVGVMAVAEIYALAAARGVRPRRSVIFALWDAEERGLLGAWYYTLAPFVPMENTVAVLNLDMIGRNEEVPEDGGRRFRGLPVQTAESNANAVNLLGYSRSPELAAAVAEANAGYGLDLRFRYDNNESNLLRRSDHWPFLQNDVPAVWFHTGLHPDYHTHEDDVDRIEYQKMARIVRLVHQTSWNLANTYERPGLEPMGPRPPS